MLQLAGPSDRPLGVGRLVFAKIGDREESYEVDSSPIPWEPSRGADLAADPVLGAIVSGFARWCERRAQAELGCI